MLRACLRRRPRSEAGACLRQGGHVTGTPFSAAFPLTSSRARVGQVVDRDARRPSRRGTSGCRRPGGRSRGGARPRPASCRRSARPRPRPRRPARRPARRRRRRGRASAQVLGVHQQLVARPAAGEPLGVVQPGVAVLLVPAADQQQLAGLGVAVASATADPVEVGHDQVRRQVDPLVRWSGVGRASSGAAGRGRRPRGACAAPASSSRPPVLSRPAITVAGVGASRALVASRSLSAARPAGDWSRSARSRKISQSCRASSRLGEHRRREARRVADREAVEDQVVVVALERRWSAAGSRRRAGSSR